MDAIIVPCTQEKVWDSQPGLAAVAAKDAYTKSAFLSWRKHAEQAGCPWFILSTKYGLVTPDQPIERYNVPVANAASNPAFLARLAEQGRELGLKEFDQLVLLDWERFQPLVRAAAGSTKCVLRKISY